MRSIVSDLADASSGELVAAAEAIAAELATRPAPESGVCAKFTATISPEKAELLAQLLGGSDSGQGAA